MSHVDGGISSRTAGLGPIVVLCVSLRVVACEVKARGLIEVGQELDQTLHAGIEAAWIGAGRYRGGGIVVKHSLKLRCQQNIVAPTLAERPDSGNIGECYVRD